VNFLGSFECFPNTHENVKFQPTFIGNYSLSIFSANKIRHKYDKIQGRRTSFRVEWGNFFPSRSHVVRASRSDGSLCLITFKLEFLTQISSSLLFFSFFLLSPFFLLFTCSLLFSFFLFLSFCPFCEKN